MFRVVPRMRTFTQNARASLGAACAGGKRELALPRHAVSHHRRNMFGRRRVDSAFCLPEIRGLLRSLQTYNKRTMPEAVQPSPGSSSKPLPATPKPFAPEDEAALREALKRCSPSTFEAAVQF